MIGEFDSEFEPHLQTDLAIQHSASALRIEVDHQWLSSADDRIQELQSYDAVWFAPGSPYLDLDRTLHAIRLAREDKIPTLGTCGGFQHMVIDFARNVAGLEESQYAEERSLRKSTDCQSTGLFARWPGDNDPAED